MGRQARWLISLVLVFMLIGAYAPVLAQDATPDASPVDVVAPDASPAPEASPVAATCDPFTSITADQQRVANEELFDFTQPENPDGSYITAATGDLQSVNPVFVESDPSLTVVGYVFDSLLSSEAQTGQPAPGGVTDYYEIATDCLTYTFHIRTDKVWHDGVDLTAHDIDFTFQALADESLASPYTGSFLDAVASWNVVDDDTIQIISNGVRADFLHSIAFTAIIAQHVWLDVPRNLWIDDPGSTGQDPSRVIGTGPFTFDSWKQGQEVRLVRNDLYTPRPAWLSEIVIRIFTDTEAEFNAFLTGEIDDIGLEPEQVQVVKDNGGDFTVFEGIPSRGFTYYEFNLDATQTTLWQDQRVRQALMYAIDRQSIVDNILLGYGEVAMGTQPVISYAYAPDQINTVYGFDPEKAKALLAEAGWVDTNGNGIVDKDGVELSFEFVYGSGSATSDSIVAYFQDAWSQIGVEMTPRALEFSALIEETTTPSGWQVALYGFSWDSTFIQDVMFACDMYLVGFNDMMYCNPDLDVLGEQIKATVDINERTPLMIDYTNVVNDEMPISVLWFGQSNTAINNRLHNSFPGPWGGLGIEYIWVSE